MKATRNIIFYILLLTHTIVFAHPSSVDYNVISGRVTDAVSGAGIPGTVIYIIDLKRGTVTDSSGYYKLENLPSQRLTINFSMLGYATQVRLVNPAITSTLDIQLGETAKEIHEVIVTGSAQAIEKNRTPVAIMTLNKATLIQNSTTNIIDAIATQPGISQITTGSGISKPVIRGLGYNRVVVINDGVRQEGQQWGDEHGIELDEYSVDKVEILKGPASLSYGSDALAGVINMLSAQTLPEGETRGNVLMNYQSNNGLFGSSFNFRGNKKGFIWDARISGKQAHSYQNKLDGYVYGTGFKENAITFITGLNKSWGYSHLTLSNYNLQPGIAEGERDSLTGKFVKPFRQNDTTATTAPVTGFDNTAYDIGIPYQRISHFKAVSTNSIILNQGSLKFNFGYQRNSRKEFSDILQPDDYQLYFLLQTFTYDIKYLLPEVNDWNISFGLNGMNQLSKNLGIEFLIPEYRLFDAGAFGLIRKRINNTDISGGIRYDNRNISTKQLYLNTDGIPTASTNTDATEKFSSTTRSFNGFSASLGIAQQFTKTTYGKLNLSKGFRAPNIAELKTNGEHEGTLRYEIGNPNFKPEDSYQIDAGFGINTDHVLVEVDVFANQIDNFIYLRKLAGANGNDSLIDNLYVFQFASGRANQAGGEISTDIHPHPLDWLHFMNSFSYVHAVQANQTDSTKYLPFTPPARYSSEIKLERKSLSKRWKNGFVKFGLDYYFAQNNVYSAYQTETATPSYTLLNSAAGIDFTNHGKTVFTFIVAVTNLTDLAYQSHLSRLKYAPENFANGRSGIFNMGRNISFKLIFPFGRPLS